MNLPQEAQLDKILIKHEVDSMRWHVHGTKPYPDDYNAEAKQAIQKLINDAVIKELESLTRNKGLWLDGEPEDFILEQDVKARIKELRKP